MIKISPIALASTVFFTAITVKQCDGFVPSPFIGNTINIKTQTPNTMSNLNMVLDPSQFVNDATNLVSTFDFHAGTSNLLSFSDQGQNLAGIFFQASLLPYLIFLYFISFRGNRVPDLGNFGFQFLLLFVFATIPSGIITKSQYSDTLANVDWLHGGAEALLTITNVLVVLGFRNAMTKEKEEQRPNWQPKLLALGSAGLFAAACTYGTGLGAQVHSAFALGAGNIPPGIVETLPWVVHSEPANALSIPTWGIHFSSVFEWLFAMNLIWNFSKTTGNDTWKGLTWGMLPLHASGIAACTYHFFYNPSSLQFLVTTQAGLTCLGNITLAIAAYRIAVSNGWTPAELSPFPKSSTSPKGIVVEENAAMSYELVEAKETDTALAAKIATLTFVSAYIVKYGSLGIDVPFTQNGMVATSIVLGIPAVTAVNFFNKGRVEGGEGGFKMPSFGGDGEGLSMADVKKFGVSGTVAYVLTELAFWAVAFPVASTTYYQSFGHWPDVINVANDRNTVLGFIFAGANIARALVPLRLGAALALAPWVDENIINRGGESGGVSAEKDEVVSAVKKETSAVKKETSEAI